MLCVPSLLDPELFVIRQAVLAARRFLIQASDQTKAQFLEVATQHSGVTHKCRGPAGALAHYLNRLSWTLDAQGYLHVDAFRKFKLVELSARKITDFLLHAWSADLLTLHSSRKAWRGHAPIHPQETQRVISSFDTKHHKALLNELSGAFQTASQQAKWDAQTSPERAYCGEHDTREHRIFSCAATLHVRDEHREQTIHRAEIYALVLLCEHFHDIDVATDSQSALSLANKCVQLEHPRDLYNHSEPDLALRLWEAVREGRYNFRKVKAHTDIQTCADLLERFDRIGNKVADETAQSICKCFNLRMIQEADGIADRLALQHDSLKDYFSYFLELQTSRAKLRKQSHQFEQHTRHDDTRESVAVKLARYSLDTVWTPDTVRFDHSRDNAWGPTWGRMFFSWLSRFRWPSDGEEVDFQNVGVTWVELALSLMLTTGQWLPLRPKGQDGKDRLVIFSSAASLTGYQVRLSEFADTMNQMFRQMETLVDVPILPPLQRKLVTATYVQGFSIHSSGLSQRPVFPAQDRVVDILSRYLAIHRGPAWDAIPSLDLPSDPGTTNVIQQETTGLWTDRCLRSQRSAARLRAIKNSDKQLSAEEKDRLMKENEDLMVNKLKGQVQEAAKMASEAQVNDEEEEEEDDEDDEPPPGWEVDQSANKARTSVSAEAYGEWHLGASPAFLGAYGPANAKKAFVPPVIVKNEEQKNRLKERGGRGPVKRRADNKSGAKRSNRGAFAIDNG
eukprot:Skav231448  [mRNA]  locus=scaffold1847:479032:487080:- [translate_table: standard]